MSVYSPTGAGAADTSATVAAAGGAVAPAASPGTDQQVRDIIMKQYPAYAFLLDIPDIMGVFKAALDPSTNNTTLTASSDQLAAQIQATNFWKTHGQSVRDYMALQYTDPESLNAKIRAQDATIHQMANKMGLADNQINIDQFARNSLMYGWTGPELQEHLASQIKYNAANPNTSAIGDVDNAMRAIKASAASYMVPIDDQTAFNYAREVAAGHHGTADYDSIFAEQAKGRFPTLSDAIDKGVTPQQYFAPIQQEVGKLLEVPPDSVDLMNDPKFSKIISYVDPKTNAPRPMTISEAQTYTRGLDQWKTTRQGQQAGADLGMSILQTFGKVAQ